MEMEKNMKKLKLPEEAVARAVATVEPFLRKLEADRRRGSP
jgi:hypothetical protein